jgi:hypothetical protein
MISGLRSNSGLRDAENERNFAPSDLKGQAALCVSGGGVAYRRVGVSAKRRNGGTAIRGLVKYLHGPL